VRRAFSAVARAQLPAWQTRRPMHLTTPNWQICIPAMVHLTALTEIHTRQGDWTDIGYGPGSDAARPDALISYAGHRVQMGAPDRHPGWPAGMDGSFAVVTRVVETPWTGSDARNVVRHRGAGSSGDAGLDGRDESA
jgi:hypothetical protein